MPDTSENYMDFARKVLIAAGILVLVGFAVIFFWFTIQIILLLFGGILLAIFIRGISNWITRKTSLPVKASVSLVLIVITLMMLIFTTLFGMRIYNEGLRLVHQVPGSMDRLESMLRENQAGRIILDEIPDYRNFLRPVWNKVSNFFFTMSGFLFSMVFIAFLGIYLAFDPGLYVEGALRLIPARRRDHIREVLQTVGYILHWWLVGRLFTMAVVGGLTIIGLFIIGIPLALTLGVFAGIISFVPYIGPLVSFVPPALLALSMGWNQVLYVLIVYTVIQTLESYILTPLIIQRTVLVPPLITLTAQVVFGMAAGIVGIVFALPVMAALIVMVKYFYIQDFLGEEIDAEGT